MIATEPPPVPIDSDSSIVAARQAGRQLAEAMAFSRSEATMIATAISELARNIVDYAGKGRITISVVQDIGRSGIRVVAEDQGPGIADVAAALTDGFSTGGSLGIGLPGARRLMDELTVESEPGHGTRVSMTKWKR